MRHVRRLVLAASLVAAAPSPVLADATLFIGSSPTPSNRPARGAALGFSLSLVGFEFEYASSSEELAGAAPGLTTVMGNALLQTPIVAGFQPYVTAGIGGYREQLGQDQHGTHVGLNTGGGVKVSVIGPLRVRLDYRVFTLRGEPLQSTVHRIYAGANIAF
jgi:opacity protein-like surface antigen